MANLSKPIRSKDDVYSVALNAAQDELIATLIDKAVEEVGLDGLVTVKESKNKQTYLHVDGCMHFDNGFISPSMVTDTERMEAVCDEPLILIYDNKIGSISEMIALLDTVTGTRRQILLIAEDVFGDALSHLVEMNSSGLQFVAVKAPGFGEDRRAILQDIAILTGGQVISDDLGVKLENFNKDMLGSAKRVVVSKEQTRIIEGAGSAKAVLERIDQIKNQIGEDVTRADLERLRERLAKLAGGVATINVGAANEAALRDKMNRCERALIAVREALDDSSVQSKARGGVARHLEGRFVREALEDPSTRPIATFHISDPQQAGSAVTPWLSAQSVTFPSHIFGAALGAILVYWSHKDFNILQLAGMALIGAGVGTLSNEIARYACRLFRIPAIRISLFVLGLIVGELTIIGCVCVALLISPEVRHMLLVNQPAQDSLFMVHVPLVFWSMFINSDLEKT